MRTEMVPISNGISLAIDRWPIGDERAVDDQATDDRATDDRATDDQPQFLLVHGLASNARLWDGVARALAAAGHRVVTVDLRGHGRSAKPAGPYDVPTVADDLAVLIERLGLGRPVAVGQSWGGNVVVELAARHPRAVRAIACIDGGWLEPRATFPDWGACWSALAPPRLAGHPFIEIEAYARSAHPGWPETGIRGLLANFERRPDGTVAPWLTFDHHKAVVRGLWDHRPSRRYAKLAVPVLLVPADTGQPELTDRKLRDVEAAAAAIRCVRVRWFTGDHDIHAQHPDQLASVLHEMTSAGFFG